ncbi:hypothetical protein [Amycolatopsis sp. lyj-23]|uniref:hypothetical protein n=1 Tax=Amycolatopsis sp. lyj-23 TaxID=2789283 RepID=UPI00397BCA97
MKCVATSRRTGNRCGNWARPGTTVCRLHLGNAPHIKEKALQRLTLAELMRANPRPLTEAVLDHVHTLDAIAQDARLVAMEEGGFTAANVQKAVDTATAALRADKLAMDIGVTKLVLDKARADAALSGEVVAGALVAIKDKLMEFLVPLPDSRTSPQAYARAIQFHEAFARWMLEAAHAAVTGHEIPDPPAPSLAVALVEGTSGVNVPAWPADVADEDSGPVDAEVVDNPDVRELSPDEVAKLVAELDADPEPPPVPPRPAKVAPLRPSASDVPYKNPMLQRIYDPQ